MDCREFESKSLEFMLSELAAEESALCQAHVDKCDCCAKLHADYKLFQDTISETPIAEPSPYESMALASALSNIQLGQPQKAPLARQNPDGFFEFVVASFAVFMLFAGLIMMQIRGVIDVWAAFHGLGALNVLGALVALVFITSFVPIMITARRRPLNGMTFRR